MTKAKMGDGTEIEVDTTDCKDVRGQTCLWLLRTLTTWNVPQNASSSPNPFECDIRPRSRKHAQIIREMFTESTHSCAPFEQELDTEDLEFLKAARDGASQNS